MKTETQKFCADLDELVRGVTAERVVNAKWRAEIDSLIEDQAKKLGRLSVGSQSALDDPTVGDPRVLAVAIADVTRKPVEISADQLQRYHEAESRYWRGGASVGPQILNEMSVGSDSEGGYVVTPERADAIKSRVFETSPIRSIATVRTISSDVWEQLLDTDEAESGGWVSEKATRAETDTPRLGLQKIEAHEQFAMPRLTQKILDDASIDFDGYIVGKIGEKFARVEATAFVLGTGVGQPRGFLDYSGAAVTTDDATRAWGVIQYVPSGAAGAFPTSGSADDADALITLQHKLKPVHRANASWLMNRATAATVRKLKDADGRWLWVDSLVVGAPATLLGSPVVLAEDMVDIASDAFAIAYGDFRAGFTIVDRLGIRVLRDPFTTKGFVKFYATKRTGSDVVNFDAIKLMKFSVS